MKDTERYQISDRAKESLRKREQTLRLEKKIFFFISIIIASVVILLCSGMKVFASSEQNKKVLNKYYTSIQVETGDTLWTLADQYMKYSSLSKQEYIDEICELNHINANELHAGQYIVVSYYSYE